MCGLIFSTSFVGRISHRGENWARCYHKCTQSACKAPAVILVSYYT